MKEYPIIFSAAMVRAILDGRKTKTRRVVTDRHLIIRDHRNKPLSTVSPEFFCEQSSVAASYCPYGKPGDRLWVRETTQIWGFWTEYFDNKKQKYRQKFHVHHDRKVRYDEHNFSEQGPRNALDGWHTRPSIHMPRWASRILLEIVSVRVERLQDISEADSRAEGIPNGEYAVKPTASFERLWQSINGPASWDANPWVWVIEFKRVQS